MVTYNIQFKTTLPTPTTLSTLPQNVNPAVPAGQEFFGQLAGSFNQTYTVTKIIAGSAPVVIASGVKVAPPNIGPRTDAVINGFTGTRRYDDAFADTFTNALSSAANANEGMVWAGPRDDGFYVDLGGIFDLANLRYTPASGGNPAVNTSKDGVSGFNCHTIALDIPTTLLTFDGNAPAAGASDQNTLAVWASASRPKVNILRNDGTHTGFGPWVQVSRIGLPLINEAVIGLQDKDKYNRTTPLTDIANFAPYFLNPVIVKDAEAVGIFSATTGQPHESGRTDIVGVIDLTNQPTLGAHNVQVADTGDVLRVDLGLDPAFPNGRAITQGGTNANSNQEDADVTDVELSLLLLGTATAPATSGIADGVFHNDNNYLTKIPYLPLPWSGFDQGHGKSAQ